MPKEKLHAEYRARPDRDDMAENEKENKKLNFIELPVIYLIFVFIMFHLLPARVSSRGLVKSIRHHYANALCFSVSS